MRHLFNQRRMVGAQITKQIFNAQINQALQQVVRSGADVFLRHNLLIEQACRLHNRQHQAL
jgi:hypothetical protein